MKERNITNDIYYIGADDKDIRLFEAQYEVPNGMAYNSYLIKDEKNVVLDTIDKNVTKTWLDNLEKSLDGGEVDYLIISHLEPDHAYNIGLLANRYPNMKIVGNQMTFTMLPNFFDIADLEKRKVVVKEGDTLEIGKHTLQFFMAPMVHWPEVMVTYEQTEKVLFTADGFGKFGTLDTKEDWDCEARRYYFGIVGKYGAQVQALLKKVSTLDIKIICPLHGPILKENLEHYIEKYNIWSSYQPENDGVLIACASIYGNTLEVAEKLKEILEEKGAKKVVLTDLVRDDMAEAVEDAFRYDKVILTASSYNAGVFVPMEQFLQKLKERNYQNRKIGIVENGSWAPSAGKTMKNRLQEMKDIQMVEPFITIKSTMKQENIKELQELADNMLGGE
ncbi:MAG: FprA family A-type flavoprotein [Clostridia bacterium]|nr:FprA family A-type flavoprotein [Clostridia bacterium]